MPLSVTWLCPVCGIKQETEMTGDRSVTVRCNQGDFQWTFPPLANMGGYCPLCHRGELYRQKDFNPRLGVGIVLVAAVLAWWTYGLSLVVAVLIDVWLYRKVPDVVICYFCLAHFRGLPNVSRYPGFELIKFDKYRSLRKAGSAASESCGEEADGRADP